MQQLINKICHQVQEEISSQAVFATNSTCFKYSRSLAVKLDAQFNLCKQTK